MSALAVAICLISQPPRLCTSKKLELIVGDESVGYWMEFDVRSYLCHLTQLAAVEGFNKFICHESFKTCNIIYVLCGSISNSYSERN